MIIPFNFLNSKTVLFLILVSILINLLELFFQHSAVSLGKDELELKLEIFFLHFINTSEPCLRIGFGELGSGVDNFSICIFASASCLDDTHIFAAVAHVDGKCSIVDQLLFDTF